MVKVLACRARNCGFESRFPRLYSFYNKYRLYSIHVIIFFVGMMEWQTCQA